MTVYNWIKKYTNLMQKYLDARNLFRMARDVAEKKPTKLITDGLPAYREAFLKEYWTRELPRTVHESHITLKGDRNKYF